MKFWLKLSWRELINHKGFSAFFILNLALGLMGFIALDSFKSSLQDHIQHQSKSLLSADISLSAYRPLNEKELRLAESYLGPVQVKAKQILLNSMLSGPNDSRLVEVNLVSENYPLYGELILTGELHLTAQELAPLLTKAPVALVQRELLESLELKVGDFIQLGEARFQIHASLEEAPGQSFWNARLSHKIFISEKWLEQTGLIQYGSHRRYNYLYQLPPKVEAKTVSQAIQAALLKKYPNNPPFRVKSHDQANPQMSRLLDYLGDYLGLAALVALFLAGLGTAYLFRAYLGQKTQEMAILRSLGATTGQTGFWMILEIAILGALASILAGLFALGLLPLLQWILQGLTPYGFQASLNRQSLGLAMAVGLSSSLFFALPLLLRLREVRPQELFQEGHGGMEQKWSWSFFASLLPLVVLYWLLAILQAKSFFVGSLFLVSLLASGLVLGALGLWGLRYAKGSQVKELRLRLIFRNLYRGGWGSLASFIAIGLGALLINLIPQLERGVQEQIQQPEKSDLPSFFLFDVQTEQTAPLGIFIKQRGFTLEHLSPMIPARIKAMGRAPEANPQDKALTREAQTKRRMRNRMSNLSMRGQLFASEDLVAGKFFTQAWDSTSGKLPEISLEARYAERFALGLGDRMTFNILGVELTGVITSLREVHWNSFSPNFFILLQPGSLDNAPMTYLGTIAKMKEADKLPLQQALRNKFPNISIIHVTRMVEKILRISSQVSLAIASMALLAMFAGLVVVYSIARYNAEQRSKEINLLKVLGAKHKDLRYLFLGEFGLLGFLASLTGGLLSLALAHALSELIFKQAFAIHWPPTIWTILLVTTLSALIAFVGAQRILNQKPLELLKAG